MNSTRWFNIEYAKQNIKKSRGVLALFLGIVPIFTALMMFSIDKYYLMIPSFSDISFINIIFFCIVPIVVSLCLFNYIYKKKSVDFICSMPISRKTIFITNMITGIILLFIMNLITSIIILLFSISGSTIIPPNMIINFFFIWFLAYAYIFTVTTLAMSISGNAITQLIITGILLVIVPFMHDYIFNNQTYNYPSIEIECKSNNCIPDNYECYDNKCSSNKKKNIYNIVADKIVKENTYPMPYSIFKELNYSTSLDDDINLINKNVVIEMIILSVGNTILGLYLFNKRKMENNETTFKNYKVHLLVKGITLLPVLVFTYEIFTSSITLLEVSIVLAIIVAYYFIYELITRKGIYHVKENIIALLVTLIVGYSLIGGINLVVKQNDSYSISNSDIKELDINLVNNLSITDSEYLKITDSNLINQIIKYTLNNYDNTDNLNDVSVGLVLNNGIKVYYTLRLPNIDLNRLSDKIKNSSDYKKYLDINANDIYAAGFNYSGYYYKPSKKLKKILKEAISKYPVENMENSNYYSYITFLTYRNGKKIVYNIDTSATLELTNYVNEMVRINNKYMASKLYEFGYFSYDNLPEGITEDEKDYIYNYFEYYIRDFIREHKNQKFDQNKDYIIIKFSPYSGNEYQFATNDIQDFIKLVHDEYNENKDSIKKDDSNDTN